MRLGPGVGFGMRAFGSWGRSKMSQSLSAFGASQEDSVGSWNKRRVPVGD